MIGLDCLNACGCSEVGLARGAGCEERRRAVIRGYAYIFKDVRANQEVRVARKRIERRSNPRRSRQRVERRQQIDLRLRYRRRAQRRPQEGDVLALLNRGLDRIRRDRQAGERNLRARLHSHCSLRVYAVNALQHRTGWVQRVSRADVCTKRREVVEVSLEILEVQREVQDVGVAKTGHCARAPCCFA